MLFYLCVLSYYVSLRYEFRVVMSVTISILKRCSVRLYLQLIIGGPMSYLRYLCLLAHSGVQWISRCIFGLFFFVSWYQFLWFVLLRLMVPVSLDCSSSSRGTSFSGLFFFVSCYQFLWIVLLRLVVPVSLDCSSSSRVTSFSRLFFFVSCYQFLWIVLFDCPF
jgi:hypothetical protein